MKEITVTIKPDGTTSIDLQGFQGKECEKTMEDFTGGEPPKVEKLKPEYHRDQEREVNRG